MMTKREAFFAQMSHTPHGPVPNWEFGYWETTLPAWHTQGLPRSIDTSVKANEYFGTDCPHFGAGFFVPSAYLRLSPSFKEHLLGIEDGYEIRIDTDGVTYRCVREGQQTIPHYLDYPLKGRREWEDIYLPRLQAATEARYPQVDWETVRAEHEHSGKPLFLNLDSYMGYLRNLMGFEAFAILPYDDPALFEEMVETLTCLKEAWIDRLVGHITIDMVHYWEDICYNAGPIIHPGVFRDIVVPRMARVNARIRQHLGCHYIGVDCDGNFLALLEGWIEAGVNILVPCEVDAGMDINMLLERYGDRCGFHGGIQKKALAESPEAIRREVERVWPAVRQGGYIPHLDHTCPANVPLEHYRYYLNLKRDILGCA